MTLKDKLLLMKKQIKILSDEIDSIGDVFGMKFQEPERTVKKIHKKNSKKKSYNFGHRIGGYQAIDARSKLTQLVGDSDYKRVTNALGCADGLVRQIIKDKDDSLKMRTTLIEAINTLYEKRYSNVAN